MMKKSKIVKKILLVLAVIVTIALILTLTSKAINLEDAWEKFKNGTLQIGEKISTGHYSSHADYLQCIQEGIAASGTTVVVTDMLTINDVTFTKPTSMSINGGELKEYGTNDASKLAAYAYLQGKYDMDEYGDKIDGYRRRYVSEVLFSNFLKGKGTIYGLGYTGVQPTANPIKDTTTNSIESYMNNYSRMANEFVTNSNLIFNKTASEIDVDTPIKLDVKSLQMLNTIQGRKRANLSADPIAYNATNSYYTGPAADATTRGSFNVTTGVVVRIIPYDENGNVITDFAITDKNGNKYTPVSGNYTGAIASISESSYCLYYNSSVGYFSDWANGFKVAPTNSDTNIAKVKVEYAYILYSGRYAVLDASAAAGGNCHQSQAIFVGDKKVFSGSFEYDFTGIEVYIQKKQADETTNLPLANITFDIYKGEVSLADADENNINKIATLKTDSTGKTGTVTLAKGKYTIIEQNIPSYINGGYGYQGRYIDNNSRRTVVTIERDTTVINVSNNKKLRDINFEKDGKNGIQLGAVEFRVKIEGEGTKYIQLLDENNNKVSKVSEEVTINESNAKNTKYQIRYVDYADATTFVTDSNGKIKINNLEEYCLSGNKYKYTLIEIKNQHYGYKGNVGKTKIIEDNETTSKLDNTPQVFPLQINKVDADDVTVKLENVEFKVRNDSGYIRLVDANNNTPQNNKIKGTARISETGKSYKDAENNTYYLVQYVSESEATTFITDVNGIIRIEGLEFYKDKGVKYTYVVKETKVLDYYFDLGEVTVIPEKVGQTEYVTNDGGQLSEGLLKNKKKYTDIGGYVWEDQLHGKDKVYDNIYSDDEKRVQDMKVELVDTSDNNKVIATTTTDANGEYGFKKVEIEKLTNYEVKFYYDGLIYTSVVVNTSTTKNVSRAAEDATLRGTLNNQYDNITGVVSENNTINATTKGSNNLKSLYDAKLAKEINFGIRERVQPDISVAGDIEAVVVTVNGKEFLYEYGTRKQYIESGEAFDVKTKFQNSYTGRYVRSIYASDVKAANENNTKLDVYVIYSMVIKNESSVLKERIYSITNYYDDDYTIEAVGNSRNNANVSNELTRKDEAYINGLKKTTINLSENNRDITGLDAITLYAKYKVSENAVVNLLNESPTLYHATELSKYASYYTASTYEGSNQKVGSLYAGIDVDSTPNNAGITISNTGNKLDIAKQEDDTDVSPSFVLEASGARTISGIVWEDATTYNSETGRLGNGERGPEDMRTISGVTVELLDAGSMQVAKYSDGTEVRAVSDKNGNYTFGKVEGNNYVGIIPGDYIIRFTYGDNTKLVDASGNETELNSRNYKSTIIKQTSETFKTGATTRWYTVGSNEKYSDAIDNLNLRNSMSTDIINNSTITSNKTMFADTPKLDIGVEYTIANAAKVDANGQLIDGKFVENCTGIDLGLAERAKVDVNISKTITFLKITTQSGSVIVQGDPSKDTTTMQFVKSGLKGIVPAEIDTALLSGALVEVEYTISITNNSELDYKFDINNYESINYYVYGTKPSKMAAAAIEINNLGDYLGGGMQLDPNKARENAVWSTTSADELLSKGLINEDVRNAIKEGYIITTTSVTVPLGETAQVKMYTSKTLAAQNDDISFVNYVEALEYKGTDGKAITNSIPGNYDLTDDTKQNDSSNVELIITDPTGQTINYIIYVLVGLIAIIITTVGVVIIKKKVIRA